MTGTHLAHHSLAATESIGQVQQNTENDERRGNEPQRPERFADGVLQQNSNYTDGDGSRDYVPPQSRLGALLRCQRSTGGLPSRKHAQKPGTDDVADVTREVQNHGQLRADLSDGGEGCTRVGCARQKQTRDTQVCTRRNGQKLGQALDEPQNHCFNDARIVHPIIL